MLNKTLFAEATVEIARPLHHRLIRRLVGLPNEKTISVPLIAEALVDSPGDPEIKIEVRDGRAGVVIITDGAKSNPGGLEGYCFIRRVTLREKGTDGRHLKALTRVVRKGVEVRRPYEAPALKPLTGGEELEAAVAAIGQAATPHTGGVIEPGLPFVLGEAPAGESILPASLVARISSQESTGAIEVEGGRARLVGPITVHGVPVYDPRRVEPGDLLRLATMETEEIAEAERLARCREATTVAKRRAGYAVREKEHRDRAAAIAKALKALSTGAENVGRFIG